MAHPLNRLCLQDGKMVVPLCGCNKQDLGKQLCYTYQTKDNNLVGKTCVYLDTNRLFCVGNRSVKPRLTLTGSERRSSRRHIEIKPRVRESLPDDTIELPSPSSPPNPPGKPNLWIAIATPLASLSFVVFTIIASPSNWWMAIPMVLVAALIPGGQMIAYLSEKKKYETALADQTRRYREHLYAFREHFEKLSNYQRAILLRENPPLETLLHQVDARDRIWDRRPIHDDFLSVRMGVGALPISVTIKAPSPKEEDPRVAEAIMLANNFAMVYDVPLTAPLKKLGTIGITGSSRHTLYMAYTMIANIAAHHSPDEVQLYIVSHHAHAASRWGWAKWLPHTYVVQSQGKEGRLSLSPATTEPLFLNLSQEMKRRMQKEVRDKPQIVVVIDNVPEFMRSPVAASLLDANPDLNASAIFIDNPIPPDAHAITHISDRGQLDYRETWESEAGGVHYQGMAELASRDQCEQIARELAPLRTSARGIGDLPGSVRLVELLGASQPDEVELKTLYEEHADKRHILDFPIGLNRDLKAMRMILREAGQGGYGSHAMLAGMTGTGKSVLLQSIVLSMAATHSPEQLNVLIGDFKAGASELKKLQILPHVVGFVTDLNEAMTERCRVALESELERRKTLMEQAGAAVKDIWSYNANFPDTPMPHLVILMDEFAHALRLNSEFRATVDTIAAQGRALGVHLFLSTQRAADFDDKIRPNIDYRVSLRVASREDSMTMLKRGEAAQIPAHLPGRGYLQVGDNDVFEEFQSARADVAFMPAGPSLEQMDEFKVYQVESDGRQRELIHHRASAPAAAEVSTTESFSEAEVLVQYIVDYCDEAGYPPARQIYLPELPEAEDLPLFNLLGGLPIYREWNESEWWATLGDPGARLRVPVGLVDLPSEQHQDPWILDFKAEDGHFWVTGAPGSGKSLLLRSMILALATTHSPADLNFYFLDFGQRALQVFDGLPHCGGTFLPTETERVSRLLEFLQAEVRRRQQLLAEGQVDSPESFRQKYPSESMPTIMVVCDNFAEFKANYIDNLNDIVNLTGVGKAVDIHLVFSTDGANDLPMNIRNNIVNRMALRFNSLDEYIDVFGRRVPGVPQIPGRGYIRRGEEILECQLATPLPEAGASLREQIQSSVVDPMMAAWAGKAMPEKIIALPPHIKLQLLLETSVPPARAGSLPIGPLGRAHSNLSKTWLDLESFGPFALVMGPPSSGRTEFLVTFCLAVASQLSPEQAEIHILDYHRGNLRHLRDLPGVTYTSGRKVAGLLEELLPKLEERAETNQELHMTATNLSLADAGQPKGPRTLLVIDDLQSLMAADFNVHEMLNRCANLRRDARLSMLLTCTPADARQARVMYDFVRMATQDRCGVMFDDPNELDIIGVQVPLATRRLHAMLPKGRGFFVDRGQMEVVQFATVIPQDQGQQFDETAYKTNVQALVEQIRAKFASDDDLTLVG